MLTLPPRGTIDFETRSQCDLRTHGSWRYALDPTTEVLCMAFRVPTWAKGRTGLWHPAFPHLGIAEGELGGLTVWEDIADLFAWIESGGLVEAHNAWFERGIWTHHMRPVCPAIQPHQWRCSAAKSAAHALPRALGNVASVLETTEQKDSEGEKVMKKMTKPRKPTKHDLMLWYRRHVPCRACRGAGTRQERKKDGTPKAKPSKCKTCAGTGHGQDVSRVPAMPVLYHETRELLEQLFTYCRQDVLSEEAVSLSLPDLDPKETELYLLDQTINERGFQLDVEAVDSALAMLAKETEALNGEIATLTYGQVERGTQRQRMIAWFKDHGLDLPDTQKGTIQGLLDSTTTLSDDVRRALELMRQLGQSSTAKYQTMKRWMCPDGRVRGGLLFHGASTGRWSGAGVQPHNFVKGKIKDMATLWDVLKHGTREEVMELYGSVMDALSSALRGVIIAAPGHRLFVADYASIEARVLLWLAEDEESLDIFRRGEDIYLSMAQDIYGRPCIKADVKERALGKIAVLGLGYQMGASRFVDTCRIFHIDIPEDRYCSTCGLPSRQHRNPRKGKRFNHAFTSDDHDVTAVQIVDAYRERFALVKQLWQDMEMAAIDATETPEAVISCDRVSWQYHRGFLYCTLPSGRKLAYPDPEIEIRPQAWGGSRPALTFMGVNPYTHQWQRQATYGGMLVENITQAVARDLMAEAMLRCEASGVYAPILSVHDEVLAEAKDDGPGTVTDFERLVAEVPTWATGLPVAADGWSGYQYRK